MSQMSPADQAIVKAMPGNAVCADCGQKNPQWASVSFGNVFCLECSGIHRSLGVHISFVRSIAMDSWTDKQMKLMKAGGNKKCNDYLKSKGIAPNTPVKAKYESDVAQLYKECLKARVEGRPEPTSLPPPKNKRAAAPASAPANTGGFGPKGSTDPNGLERMTGETEQQYIARQTRLRAEAKARMQAKFGNGGQMGGVGSSSMQGIGSNPNYNPHSGYGGGYGAPDVSNLVSGVTGAFSTGLSLVSSAVNDESTRASVSNLASTATSYGGSLASTATSVGGSFWNSLKTTVGDVTTTGENDGLAALQRDVAAHKPAQSKYSGFGSTPTTSSAALPSAQASLFDSFGMGSTVQTPTHMYPTPTPTPPASGGFGGVQEAPGLPHEDRNGMERLTGETEQQYVVRQTRLREEAKARMAAKFGNSGLSSAGPSSSTYSAPRAMTPPRSSGVTPRGLSLGSAQPTPVKTPPSSFGNPAFSSGRKAPPQKKPSSDDFFANFGA
mmetsp:Transcript_14596/g.30189  ORF Transcript_14596/g.30189 Transcript_14596/m.30189 type:complete len:497 (+) Transcript_14596:220-1710(+)